MIPIRALKFTPPLNNLDDEIGEYFGQFGEVESVSMHREGTNHWNLVTFKTVEAATSVLSNPMHHITNYDVAVEAAEPWLQPDQILNALNDDCLRKIFDCLGYEDVSNAADVCTRFAERAQETFTKRSYCIEVYADNIDKGMTMVRKFGSVLKGLSIAVTRSEDEIPNETIETIFRKCSVTLEYLAISNLNKPVPFHRFGCIFQKLTFLKLYKCSIPNLDDLLVIFPELKKLKIIGDEWKNGCIVRQIPKLEELNLFFDDDHGSVVNRLIMLHPGLKKLTIKFISRDQTLDVFLTISQHLRELMELDVIFWNLNDPHQFQQNVRSLGQLSSLRTLKLNFSGSSIAPLMEALAENQVPIKQLTLTDGQIDTFAIRNMSKLKQMDRLVLCVIEDLKDKHVIELAKKLPQLKELILSSIAFKHITLVALKKVLTHAMKLSYLELWLSSSTIVSIDTNDYVEMVQAIQNRPEDKKLTIKFRGAKDKVRISDDVLIENRNWLEIIV